MMPSCARSSESFCIVFISALERQRVGAKESGWGVGDREWVGREERGVGGARACLAISGATRSRCPNSIMSWSLRHTPARHRARVAGNQRSKKTW